MKATIAPQRSLDLSYMPIRIGCKHFPILSRAANPGGATLDAQRTLRNRRKENEHAAGDPNGVMAAVLNYAGAELPSLC